MTKQKMTKTENQKIASYETLSTKDFGLNAPDKNMSMVGFSTWVRALMQNWRQGTVGCKDRSEVAFSNRKPWKQKGTGRARAGSLRSPLWRKGGITFGPQPRVRTLKVSKSLRKTVLGAIAYNQLDAGKVAYLDWTLSGDKPQTRVAYSLLKNAQLTDKNVTIFLPVNDALTYASFINIPNARILFYDQANAFDLVRGGNWIVFKKDIDLFKEMVGQWI
ncbi:MAG: 50S ribosomal protein L4 [Candidatus Babeliales bacterium]|nr:50S ribosomal protein L4 [Candidatus Babeliales bacterium]